MISSANSRKKVCKLSIRAKTSSLLEKCLVRSVVHWPGWNSRGNGGTPVVRVAWGTGVLEYCVTLSPRYIPGLRP